MDKSLYDTSLLGLLCRSGYFMRIGYVGFYSFEKEEFLEGEIRKLEAVGCEKILTEQFSIPARHEFCIKGLELTRPDDVVVVSSLCRLADNVPHLVQVLDRLNRKNVALEIVDIGIDSRTPTGKLMLDVVISVGEFDREMANRRRREGVNRAKIEGNYRNRRSIPLFKVDQVKLLHSEGVSYSRISKQLSISKATVHRVLRKMK